MTSQLKKFRMLGLAVAIGLILWIFKADLALAAATNAARFLIEVLLIVPPVMILMGLLNEWLARKLVEDRLGADSGFPGAILALVLGTAAAGPLYAAFPLALSLRQKGAAPANIVIFLSSWATIKVPMILMESSFIGLRFALLRLAFTVPGVLGLGYLMRKLAPDPGSPGSLKPI